MSSFTRRYNQIMKESVTAVLKPLGFKKDRNYYRCQHGEVTWILDVQKDKINTRGESRFTLNLGIFTSQVVAIYINQPEASTIQIPDCCLEARLGILGESRDRWWTLKKDDEDDEDIQDIRGRIKKDGLPFFNAFKPWRILSDFFLLRGEKRIGFSTQEARNFALHTPHYSTSKGIGLTDV